MTYFVAAFASFAMTMIAGISTQLKLWLCALLGCAVPAAGLIALLDKTASGLWLLASLVILAVTGAGAAAGAYAARRMRA